MVTNVSAVITWVHNPNFPGIYSLKSNSNDQYLASANSNSTFIKLVNLWSYTEYHLMLSFWNNLTELYGENTTKGFQFKTKPGGNYQLLNT